MQERTFIYILLKDNYESYRKSYAVSEVRTESQRFKAKTYVTSLNISLHIESKPFP